MFFVEDGEIRIAVRQSVGASRSLVHSRSVIRPKNIGYILLLIVWVYLQSNVHGGLQKKHVFWITVHNGCSRSSKVIDFGTNQKHVCNFLLVSTVLHHFRDVPRFLLKTATCFMQNLDKITDVGSLRSEDPKLIKCGITFEITKPIWWQITNVKDGQTLSYHCVISRCFCTYVRCVVKMAVTTSIVCLLHGIYLIRVIILMINVCVMMTQPALAMDWILASAPTVSPFGYFWQIWPKFDSGKILAGFSYVAGFLQISSGTKLYCLVTETHGCEQLA